jgi:hypothetical protein
MVGLMTLFVLVNVTKNSLKKNLLFSLRIYPHFQDTGGFFIAVFEKIGPIKDISALNDTSMNDEDGENTMTESFDNVEADDDASIKPDSTATGYEIINEDTYDLGEMNQDESVSIKRPSSTDQSGEEPHKRTKTKENLKTASKPDDKKEDENQRKIKQSEEVFIFLEPGNEEIHLIRLDA